MSTEELINSLLYEEESTTLDFKSEQYKFVKAQDSEKAELLKDILAFSNAWRRTDAYILIGVKEVKGGKSLVEGISENLDDAQLQQFVNSKINKPINFSYVTVEIDAKKIGVIAIPVQSRPVFLKKDYAKLKANTVYVRRGSSTEVALPDQIADMGSSDNKEIKKSPKLNVFIAGGEHDERKLDTIDESVIVASVPDKKEITKHLESPFLKQFQSSAVRNVILGGLNSEYYARFADYLKATQSFFCIKIGVENTGNHVARDVKAVLDFKGLPKNSVVFHGSRIPKLPKPNHHDFLVQSLNTIQPIPDMSIKTIPEGYRATIDLRKIQSKDSRVCSELLCLQASESCQISASVTIFSDDLEFPEKIDMSINVSVEERAYSVSEIMKLADDVDTWRTTPN